MHKKSICGSIQPEPDGRGISRLICKIPDILQPHMTKSMFYLLLPLNNVTSMSTQIFCGHPSNLELPAASLDNNGV
ncbi:hypothetical protein HanRHA438_Chr16g0744361 [Helianthus annuus]|nr:hypothetical protein HanIR_Chr16g0796021 [Helianthus annuus]KAJ0834504.1 hypothetical protein HanRHA438_Chr16g0744361 [Helianthus annuus]